MMLRAVAATSGGAAWPERSQAAAIRAGMSPGARKRVVVGVEQRHVALDATRASRCSSS